MDTITPSNNINTCWPHRYTDVMHKVLDSFLGQPTPMASYSHPLLILCDGVKPSQLLGKAMYAFYTEKNRVHVKLWFSRFEYKLSSVD